MDRGIRICAAVLAAGQSRRFEGGDKLAQLLHGKQLGLHICEALPTKHFSDLIIIAPAIDHPCAAGWLECGFEVVANPDSAKGLASSVAKAATIAIERSADALLICLADMPFVPTSHLNRLIDRYEQSDADRILASCSGETTSPPAIFGSHYFKQLTKLEGENGARQLLSRADAVPLSPELLIDIDTVAALSRANARKRPV